MISFELPDGNGRDLGIAGCKIWEWDLSFRWEYDGLGMRMKSLK